VEERDGSAATMRVALMHPNAHVHCESPAQGVVADISVPDYWASHHDALADAIGGEPVVFGSGPRSSAAAISSNPSRVTRIVEEAATSLGISRASAYEAVRRGEIPAICIGRRILVPRAALERSLASAMPIDDHKETGPYR
jgi:excisionase family DNA binding protein